MAKKNEKSPYEIIKRQHVTEKAVTLQQLQTAESSKTLRRCEAPKYVFIVDRKANKQEIANAVESMYEDKKIKVTAVNTINVKSKPRRVRGRPGRTAQFKKAVVTLEKGDSLEDL